MTVLNVIIEGNTVMPGFSTTAGYTYDRLLFSSSDAVISNNSLTGITSNASTSVMLDLDSCACNINNNLLTRGNSNVLVFIRNTGSTKHHKIVENIFDKSTTNGTNDNISTGLTTSTIFSQNKNQVIYIAVPILSGEMNSKSGSYAAINETTYVVVANDYYSGGKTNIVDIAFSDTNTNRMYMTHNISSILPDNLKILEVKMGAHILDIPTSVLASGNIDIGLASQSIVRENFSSGTGSIMDMVTPPAYTYESLSYDVDVNFAALKSNTQYLSLPLSSSTNFVNTRDFSIVISFTMLMELTSGQFVFRLSPFVFKCIW